MWRRERDDHDAGPIRHRERQEADPDGADDDDDVLAITALAPEDGADELYGETYEEAYGGERRIPSGRMRGARAAWRASGVIVALALLMIVAVTLAPHVSVSLPAAPVEQPRILRLRVPSDAAGCLSVAGWSNDGRQIASLRSQDCGAPYLGAISPRPNVYLFDGATGALARGVALDGAVQAALDAQKASESRVSQGATLNINYFSATWSPDGHTLAVQFQAYVGSLSEDGVALIPLERKTPTPRVMIDPAPPFADTDGRPPDGLSPQPVVRWDTQAGAYSTVYLEPSVAYHWLPGDALVATAPLATDPLSAPPAPDASAVMRGNPIGGQGFTMWQRGLLNVVNATACAPTPGRTFAPYTLLTLSMVAWSPDGRYLLNTFTQGRLPYHGQVAPVDLAVTGDTQPAAGSPSSDGSTSGDCLVGPAPETLPRAPLRDAALSAVVSQLTLRKGAAELSWSPDGRRMACAAFAENTHTSQFVVYDTASGRTLHAYTGAQFARLLGWDASLLLDNLTWSPDGERVVMGAVGPETALLIVQPQSLDG